MATHDQHSKALAISTGNQGLLNLSVQDLLSLARPLVATRFLPGAVDTPEKAMAIMLKGQELRIPPMYALSNIAVIEGKPTAGAELLLALIYRDHGDEAVMFDRTDADVCTISYKRRGWKERRAYSFTMKEIQAAGINQSRNGVKDNWRKYPAAMLRARCISAVARMAFPDSIGGMYTPEELGAQVTVDPETEEVVPVVSESSDDPEDVEDGEYTETSEDASGPAPSSAPTRQTAWDKAQRYFLAHLAGKVGCTPQTTDPLLALIKGELDYYGDLDNPESVNYVFQEVKKLDTVQRVLKYMRELTASREARAKDGKAHDGKLEALFPSTDTEGLVPMTVEVSAEADPEEIPF